MKEKKFNYIWLPMICALPVLTAAMPAAAAPTDQEVREVRQQSGYDDTGVQLNRIQRYLEQQRILERIEEGRQNETIEDNRTTDENGDESAAIRFVLNEIRTSESRVLTEEELSERTAPYIGKEIGIDDLYEIVDSINAYYKEKGYITCRAFLKPQTIREGIVEITLVEGSTGEVTLQGAETTRESYIRHRIRLKEAEIANIHELNDDILRFNATNDVRLHLELKAGKEVGTTDYVVTAYEPQRTAVGFFMDNAGSKTSGQNRAGIYFIDRSLTGSRDHLMLSLQRSEGVKAGSFSYTTPINRSGSKIGFSYSANSVEITDGPFERLGVRGHASSYALSWTQPVSTRDRLKSEWGIELGKQHSVTNFMNMPWVDDDLKTAKIFIDRVNYGRTSVFYQKHSYQMVKYDGLAGRRDGTFGKYILNTFYQKSYKSKQTLTLRLDGQYAFKDYLPSASMYYIGGNYSVRGYKESLLSGDSGVSFSAEYSMPIAKKDIMGYVFFDGGSVFGDSAFDDHTLMSVGLGVRANLGKKMTADVGLGVPLIRDLNGEKQDNMRVHFSVNGQF